MATETKKTEGAAKGADSTSDKNGAKPEETEAEAADKGDTATTEIRGKSPRADSEAKASESAAPADEEDDFVASDNPYDTASPADGGRRSGAGAAAAAAISGALGLISLTGSPLTDMVREHKQVSEQVKMASSGGGGGDQIKTIAASWHSAALVNGVIAFVAVVLGGVLLAVIARRANARTWVKAVALSGVVLGVLGLVVSGGMYADLFGSWPSMPPMPQQPQSPTG